jgi:3-deoxy-manno-octulosonate cytidylyltransferase (CMP-KDO synthetase)
MTKILAVIPARYASTRFPGKPLVMIAGKSMIQHVWERVSSLSLLDHVVVATDDDRIESACRSFGADVQMTSPEHPSGTDRVWEVAKKTPQYDWVLNVQGDEPQINIDDLAKMLQLAQSGVEAEIITLVSPIESASDFADSNIVKAVLAHQGQALYFSRAGIPFNRDEQALAWKTAFRHIGVYLYRRTALEAMTKLSPSPLEMLEKLEQLRALEAGMTIMAVVVPKAPVGIDTPADLERFKALL